MAYPDSFRQHLTTTLAQITTVGLWKTERTLATTQGPRIAPGDGCDVLNFSANNYLGLADDPRVLAATHAALDRWGYGLASVRFIRGTQEIHRELESALGGSLGTEDTILYSSCFDANGGVFETLLGPEDAVSATPSTTPPSSTASASPKPVASATATATSPPSPKSKPSLTSDVFSALRLSLGKTFGPLRPPPRIASPLVDIKF